MPCGSYTKSYETFLNDVSKIRFKWRIDKRSKEITYRDLTGPEKVRLHQNINIPVLKRERNLGDYGMVFSLINTGNLHKLAK